MGSYNDADNFDFNFCDFEQQLASIIIIETKPVLQHRIQINEIRATKRFLNRVSSSKGGETRSLSARI